MEDSEVDYDEIINTVYQGSTDLTDKDKETLPGIDDIRKRYVEEWNQKEETSGMNYTDKMDVYVHDVLPTRMEDGLWKTIGVEQNFEFVYNNKCIVHGFIDRIDQNSEGDLKVVDYKSSKKVFRDTEIKTPLQMVIYDLACVFIYGVLPKYHEYDFILLNQKQTTEDGVCTKGYLKRGIKKIDKLLDQIKLLRRLEYISHHLLLYVTGAIIRISVTLQMPINSMRDYVHITAYGPQITKLLKRIENGSLEKKVKDD